MADVEASALDVPATPTRPHLTGISSGTLVIFFGLLTIGLAPAPWPPTGPGCRCRRSAIC